METYVFLYDIALILVFTKLFGLLTRKAHLPQVLGALLGGIILGPALLGWVKSTEFIQQIAEIGVIFLMFMAGMETNIKQLKMSGKTSIIIALLGVIVPILGGIGLGYVFNIGGSLMESIFIGVILSATSVSITVETLREMGQLNSRVGDSLLAASILDDVIGVVLLSFVTPATQSAGEGKMLWTIGKIVIFFVIAIIIWFISSKVFSKWFAETEKGLKRYAIAAVALCLFLSFASEHFFGVANIIGAFLAGLIFSDNTKNNYLSERMGTLSDLFFAPIFFASVGLKVDLSDLSGSMIWFAVALSIIAILTKFFGAGLGAKISGFTTRESIQVGCGMVSRGEVAMMIANKGIIMGLLGQSYFPPIILMVIVTTLISPILLKLAWKTNKQRTL